MIVILLAGLGILAVPFLMAPTITPLVQRIGMGTYVLMWLSLIIGMVIIHEGLHGLFFWIYSRKVNFGVKWKTRFGPTPYASSPHSLFTKRQYQMMGIAPQILTAVLLCSGGAFAHVPIAAIGIMVAATNLGGGCVDLWAAFEIQRMPKDILVEDTGDGFKVWSNERL
jgi:hypothetical protein